MKKLKTLCAVVGAAAVLYGGGALVTEQKYEVPEDYAKKSYVEHATKQEKSNLVYEWLKEEIDPGYVPFGGPYPHQRWLCIASSLAFGGIGIYALYTVAKENIRENRKKGKKTLKNKKLEKKRYEK